MSEIVERVVAAIKKTADCDSGVHGMHFIANPEEVARAAIEAMREPTDAMSDAGETAVYDCYSLEPGEGFDEPPGDAAWRAMIDAALKEPT